MPPKNQKSRMWTKQDEEFIEVVKEYDLDNAFGNKLTETGLEKEVWREIATRVNMQANLCRRKWLRILHNYLKLKNMIYIGRVTEDKVKKHVRTSKYLDGRLDFLDRYIFELPDAKLPASAHRFFDSVFGTNTSTPSVDAGKLIKVKENSDIEVIKDFKEKTGTEPTSILPNIEHYESEAFVNLGTDQTIKDRMDYDLNDVKFMEPDVFENILIKQEDPTDDNVETNLTSGSLKKRERNAKKPSKNCDLARFLVKYTNRVIENDKKCNLKQYMDDLAELLCRRLVPKKRKYFLSQIDLLVSEILEGK